jgi:hypothetical protein
MFARFTPTVGAFAILFAACLALTGCGGGPGLTMANYDKIKTDGSMTKEDVDKLLGQNGVDLPAEAAKQWTQGVQQVQKGIGIEMPPMPGLDVGKAFDGLLGMMPKAVRWGDDNKFVVCVIMNAKVIGKDQKGL